MVVMGQGGLWLCDWGKENLEVEGKCGGRAKWERYVEKGR